MKNYPPPPPVFGVEINRGYVSQTVSKASDAGIYWVRYNGVLWHEIEPNEGQSYNWNSLVDQELTLLRQNGLEPVVIIRGTPSWAQMAWGLSNKTSQCGPIHQEKLAKFAKFVQAVIQRYSAPPYSVRYWELGNEPDVDPALVPYDSPFGCWGNEKDDYYGGSYFAEMLKAAYPAIKSVNPSARVVFGGLLLDCDPNNPPPGKSCKPAKFLEGALRNDGGRYFDILAYHAYPSWLSHSSYGYYYDYDLNFYSWQHRGGILRGKLSYLREILSTYGYTNKPIHMNEGGLICWTNDTSWPCDLDEFYKSQGNFAVRMNIRLWTSGVEASNWYTLNGPGWRNGGMLNGTTPRSNYYTTQFLATQLTDAEYVGNLSTSNYEGYEFINRSADKRFRIYWTNKNSNKSISIPGSPIKAYRFNSQNPPFEFQELSSFDGIVSFDPIFLIFAP